MFSNAIQIDVLEQYFKTKFQESVNINNFIKESVIKVKNRYNTAEETRKSIKDRVSVYKVKKVYSWFKSKCSLGLDGISAEHFKYATDTRLVYHISNLLTLCVRFNIVPDSFLTGM